MNEWQMRVENELAGTPVSHIFSASICVQTRKSRGTSRQKAEEENRWCRSPVQSCVLCRCESLRCRTSHTFACQN